MLKNKKISVILPIYNEEGNIKKIIEEINKVLNNNYNYEIITVDDGSGDKSLVVLKEQAKLNQKIKVISFTKNFGQTAALYAGIENSTGDIIVLIDSDLENDPNDIIMLINKLDEGYDVISGWRDSRWSGSWLTRKLPSVIANWLISKISGLKLHDYGCTLKVYKKKVIKNIQLYGEMHRFIPIYSFWQGGKITEMKVNYRKRIYGKSNYGIYRTFRVLLDLILMKFLEKYINRPIHFFGGIGFISFFIGISFGFLAVLLKIFNIRHLIATPLPILSTLFIIVGIQLIAMGIIAEMIMRTYFEAQNKKPYNIKNKINF